MRLGLTAAAALLIAGLAAGGAHAQPSPSAYTSATRYDAMGRVTGTISPDADAIGTHNPFLAVRNTYDARGRLIRAETGTLANWQSETVAPSAWSGFTIYRTLETDYDLLGRKLVDRVREGAVGTVRSVTQYSYDNRGRLACTAARMNPAAFGALPGSACTLGTEGAFGPDRITHNVYDVAGQLLQEQRAYATPLQQNYATYTYNLNGQRTSLTDANGNRAEMTYDGHARQSRWTFPSLTTPGNANASNYEEYGYDAAGNRTSLRRRDGSELTFQYDALNRMTVKVVPERSGLSPIHTRDVYYGYDLRGLQLSARFDSASGEGVTNSYDGFGRLTSSTLTMDGVSRALTHQYDANGNRTRVTHPDATFFTYTYDGLNRLWYTTVNNASQLNEFRYDAVGQLSTQNYTALLAGDSAYGYDGVGWLTSLAHNVTGSGHDVSFGFAHNPASQLISATRDNNAYAWAGAVSVNRPYTVNGLNQYTAAGGTSFFYDANGNLITSGADAYLYDVENRLVGASGDHTATLRYSRAVRAPNIFELFGPVNTGLTNLNDDPCANLDDNGNAIPGRPVPTGELLAVCLAQGAPAGQIGAIGVPTAGQTNATGGGNLALRPETSTSWTVGAVFQPSFVPGLSLSVDYYNIRITGAITSPTPGDAVEACFGPLAANGQATALPPGASGTAACTIIRRNPTTGQLSGNPAVTPGLFLSLSNLGLLEASGVDFTLNYRRNLDILGGMGLAFNFVLNWTDQSIFEAVQGVSGPRECTGFYSVNCTSIQPEWQWSLRTTATFDNIDISLLWRHIDAVIYEPGQAVLFAGTLGGGLGPLTGQAVDFNSIPSADYFDLTGRFAIDDHLTITLSVQNLLDRQPPVVGSTAGSTLFNSGNTYPSTYDALGRRFVASARIRF